MLLRDALPWLGWFPVGPVPSWRPPLRCGCVGQPEPRARPAPSISTLCTRPPYRTASASASAWMKDMEERVRHLFYWYGYDFTAVAGRRDALKYSHTGLVIRETCGSHDMFSTAVPLLQVPFSSLVSSLVSWPLISQSLKKAHWKHIFFKLKESGRKILTPRLLLLL